MAKWTHAICEKCWKTLNPGRSPTRLRDARVETCCECGCFTQNGVYIRKDPKTVKYPTKEG